MEIAFNAGITLAVFATATFIAGLFFAGLAYKNGEFSEEILEEG